MYLTKILYSTDFIAGKNGQVSGVFETESYLAEYEKDNKSGEQNVKQDLLFDYVDKKNKLCIPSYI